MVVSALAAGSVLEARSELAEHRGKRLGALVAACDAPMAVSMLVAMGGEPQLDPRLLVHSGGGGHHLRDP